MPMPRTTTVVCIRDTKERFCIFHCLTIEATHLAPKRCILLGSRRTCDTFDNTNSTIHLALWIPHHSLGILVIIINGIQWMAVRSCSSQTSQIINQEVFSIIRHYCLLGDSTCALVGGSQSFRRCVFPQNTGIIIPEDTVSPPGQLQYEILPLWDIKYHRILRSSKTYLVQLTI